ncbi:Na(+)/citrate cotransporter-like [Rhopilema esculentum]|uniref:Na(+)/citrate cotransporter-like n=1 Tax=Rhopilema esculentum TaxID=499914 RepID=UPI0031E24125|eukprot:gene15344-6569_t
MQQFTATVAAALKRLAEWKRFLIIFLTPLLLCPIPLVIETKEARTGFAILLMGVYWCTEVTDLAVTSLLPLLLFPVLKVVSAKEIAPKYFADTNILLLGGLLMAVAIERWNVHKRIALKVLLIVGAQPRRLMLGFMLTTAFISMWITNTATTAMMTPIMEAVLKELDKEYLGESDEDEDEGNDNASDGNLEKGVDINITDKEKEIGITNDAVELKELGLSEAPSRSSSTRKLVIEPMENLDDPVKTTEQKDPKKERYLKMCKAMMLSICYAANIGGTGTLTGTAPQLVLAGQLRNVFKNGPGISFLDWFVYAFPEMLFFLIIAWLYLQFMFFGIGWKHLCFCFRGDKRNKSKGAKINALIKQQYQDLGPTSFAEKAVLVHFLLLVLCWILRDPKFIPGWGSLFEVGGKSYVTDATAAIFIAFSMFLFPSVRPELFGGPRSAEPHIPLLEWKPTQRKFPWNIILLLGSGFALAHACEKSGLSLWIGCQLTVLGSIPNFAIALCISVLITFLTEFTSNTATATIILPILASLAQSINVHPFYLMIPATICSSFAFMLPVATPPNAIVFATGRLTIPDMMKAGFGMNIIGIIVVTISINTLGLGYYGLNKFPAWASSGDSTDKCNPGKSLVGTTIATLLTTANTTSRIF